MKHIVLTPPAPTSPPPDHWGSEPWDARTPAQEARRWGGWSLAMAAVTAGWLGGCWLVITTSRPATPPNLAEIVMTGLVGLVALYASFLAVLPAIVGVYAGAIGVYRARRHAAAPAIGLLLNAGMLAALAWYGSPILFR